MRKRFKLFIATLITIITLAGTSHAADDSTPSGTSSMDGTSGKSGESVSPSHMVPGAQMKPEGLVDNKDDLTAATKSETLYMQAPAEVVELMDGETMVQVDEDSGTFYSFSASKYWKDIAGINHEELGTLDDLAKIDWTKFKDLGNKLEHCPILVKDVAGKQIITAFYTDTNKREPVRAGDAPHPYLILLKSPGPQAPHPAAAPGQAAKM